VFAESEWVGFASVFLAVFFVCGPGDGDADGGFYWFVHWLHSHSVTHVTLLSSWWMYPVLSHLLQPRRLVVS